MSFFRGVKETFRDRTRDRICAGLQRLGIDAQVATRGRPVERVGGSGSLGLIDINDGPISWVNVLSATPLPYCSLRIEDSDTTNRKGHHLP